MDAAVSSARQARTQHRHELRTLTYVTLDQANGGIIRNLTHEGIAAQVVAAVRPQQQLRVRFELHDPRLRVETRGEVVWSTSSGQCGIRFLDVSAKTRRQINEWIFGDLLNGAELHTRSAGWMFGEPALPAPEGSCADEDDGLTISQTPLKVIELPMRQGEVAAVPNPAGDAIRDSSQLDWLSQPLSGRGLAWTVNILMVFAALLLFALIFLSVTREAPKWPLEMTGGATLLVAAMYWGFFQMFGGRSFGQRLARLAGSDGDGDEGERDSRFR